MNVKTAAVPLFAVALWPFVLSAQGFAGLGTQADDFAVPQKPAPNLTSRMITGPTRNTGSNGGI